MTTVTVDLPESVFSSLRLAPGDFIQQMRISAAIKWYEQELISQDKATEIAGISHAVFISELSKAKVSLFQITEEELSNAS